MREMEKTDTSLVFRIGGYNSNHYRSLRHGTDPSEFEYKVLVEGDSWANILYPWSEFFGYNEAFPNFIERDPRFYYNNVGWPGDTLENIVERSLSPNPDEPDKGLYVPIRSGIFDFLIFSGGGNDFLGGGELKKFLKPYRVGVSDPWECLDKEKVDGVYSRVTSLYRKIIKLVNVSSPHTHIFVHGYDHAVPRSGGRWLGTPFSSKGYTPEAKICRDIIASLVDRMYNTLEAIASSNDKVHVVNVRGLCQNNWHDELHPNRPAAKAIAEKFISTMIPTQHAHRALSRAAIDRDNSSILTPIIGVARDVLHPVIYSEGADEQIGGMGMAKSDYRPVRNLENSVLNRKLQVRFGTLLQGGWFSAAPADTSVNRAIRTNNPGALNITSWQKKRPGYIGYTDPDSSGNRTTIYQIPECGVAAWYYLISEVYGFGSLGQFDLKTIARKYAGSGAAESAVRAYLDGWSHWSGGSLHADTVIHLASEGEILNFAKALFAHEAAAYSPLDDKQIAAGINLDKSIVVSLRGVIKIQDKVSMLESVREASAQNQLETIYESGLDQLVLNFGEHVLESPSAEGVADWLNIYAILSGLSLEGPADITAKLIDSNRELIDAVAASLDPEVLYALEELDLALNSKTLTFQQMEIASRDAEQNTARGEWRQLSAGIPLLAVFNISQENTDARVVRYTGELIIHDREGAVLGTYAATTGGFVASYKRTNGPTPPGYYVVSHYRKRSESWATRGSVGFTFDIDEIVHTGSRSAFRIHPDGAPPGTHGCIGVVENGVKLEDCRDKIRSILSSVGEFRLLVRYGANEPQMLLDSAEIAV